MKTYKVKHDYSEVYVGIIFYLGMTIYFFFNLVDTWDYERFNFSNTIFYIIGIVFFSRKLIKLLKHPFLKIHDDTLFFSWFGLFKKEIRLDQIQDVKYLINAGNILRRIALKSSGEEIEIDRRFIRNIDDLRHFFSNNIGEDIQSENRKPSEMSSCGFVFLLFIISSIIGFLVNFGYISFDLDQMKYKLPLCQIKVVDANVTLSSDETLINVKVSNYEHPIMHDTDLGVHMFFQAEEYPNVYFKYQGISILKNKFIAINDTLVLPQGSKVQLKVRESDYKNYIQPNSLGLLRGLFGEFRKIPIYGVKYNDEVLFEKEHLLDVTSIRNQKGGTGH